MVLIAFLLFVDEAGQARSKSVSLDRQRDCSVAAGWSLEAL